jgi:hypothetical protein
LFPTTVAGSLPKPSWLAEPNKLWAPWRLQGDALAQAKDDATLLALKVQEDAGIDIVGDGEQARQHFPRAQIRSVQAPATGFQEVLAGRADITITSNVEASTLTRRFDQLTLLGPEVSPRNKRPFAYVVAQDDPIWLNFVNTWIWLKKSEGMFDALEARWEGAAAASPVRALAVARDVQMGELTSCRLHIAHLSATSSLELVRAAKSKGLPVTCEVTPHHFTLTDEDVQYDTRFKMNPPLASREDRDALITGLADGTVDAIATDHAPHEAALKDVEFDRAPFGVTGFETAIGLALELVHAGTLSLNRMVELFTSGPARVLGMKRSIAENEPGDLTIFSTEHKWTFRAAESASKSRNSPFDGREFRGGPVATIVAGRIAHRQ